MDHFAGLDVSVKETSVCIVDDTGKIVREVKEASEPEALLAVLKNPAYHFKRIGLEAGPLSQWLFSAHDFTADAGATFFGAIILACTACCVGAIPTNDGSTCRVVRTSLAYAPVARGPLT